MDFDTIIVGAGICGLSIAVEIADEDLLILEEKENIYQTSSANALGILGGHGCLSSEKPQSHFRCLLKKSLQLYPGWLKKHFGENALRPIFIEDHLYLNQKNKNTYRLRKLIENEKSNVILQKPRDFFENHPQILHLLHLTNNQQEILNLSKSTASTENQIATFSDTMIINVHKLILMMEEKIKEKNVLIKCKRRIEKIKFQKNKVLLTVRKTEKNGKTGMEVLQCRRLILAAGAQTAHLLSLVGYRIKSFFSWAEQLHDIPLPTKINDGKMGKLSRWSEGKMSYLFSLSSDGIKLSLTGFQQKNKWNLTPSKNLFGEWLRENVPGLYSELENISTYKRYGVRARTKNWLPLVGFLDEKIFIATSVYKSGITLAPLISHIASLLLKKKSVSEEDQKIIEILSPLSQHQKKILRPYTDKDLSWLHYPFFY